MQICVGTIEPAKPLLDPLFRLNSNVRNGFSNRFLKWREVVNRVMGCRTRTFEYRNTSTSTTSKMNDSSLRAGNLSSESVSDPIAAAH